MSGMVQVGSSSAKTRSIYSRMRYGMPEIGQMRARRYRGFSPLDLDETPEETSPN